MKNRHALNFFLATILLSTTVLTLHIPFARAIDWSPENQLTTDQYQDAGPAIMQAHDGTVWVVWSSNRIEWGHDYELFFKTSSDYGLDWSNDTRLTEEPIFNGSEDTSPSIMQASNGTIWVVWSSLRTGDYELFQKTSSNNGASWSNDTQLTEDPDLDTNPSIMQSSNGTIWVVWSSFRTGDYELFYKTFNGTVWSSDIQLTTHSNQDTYPSIMQSSNGTIWVVWSSFRTGDYELFYKTFNGTVWSSDTRLTYDSAFDEAPSIAEARDGTIWVVWQYYDGQADVYYKTYDGSTWTSNMPLISDTQAHDRAPSIAQIHDRKIWVVWSTTRDANFDIYYKTTVVFPGDVNGDGIVNVMDLTLIGEACGTVRGDPDYNPYADLNCDDIVDIYDLEECSKNYG